MIAEAQAIAVVSIKYEGNYRISFTFEDGHHSSIDFREFLFRSVHPDVVKYRDLSQFQQFEIVNGDLVWNDYELCFPLEDLYSGEI